MWAATTVIMQMIGIMVG